MKQVNQNNCESSLEHVITGFNKLCWENLNFLSITVNKLIQIFCSGDWFGTLFLRFDTLYLSWVINWWWHRFLSVVYGHLFWFWLTNIVQLSNQNPYFYRIRCHHPLITQLNCAFWQKAIFTTYLYALTTKLNPAQIFEYGISG